MPIAVYPGLELFRATVRDIVTDPDTQFGVQRSLHERYGTRIVQTAMDLSAEAEAFGSEVLLSEDEIPTVRGRLISEVNRIEELSLPNPGDKRTSVYLETTYRLSKLDDSPYVLGCMIGPFSLAGRLYGVAEALETTMTEPDALHRLIEKCTEFLTAYAQAFKASGAQGILIAEPSAGLLSPKALSQFSSRYIRRIVADAGSDSFEIILHNCAAKIAHACAILESDARMLHFGAPMNIPALLETIPEDIFIFGNLDPAAVFVQKTPEEIRDAVRNILEQTDGYKNFVVSSGCDIPPGVSIDRLDAFYETVNLQ